MFLSLGSFITRRRWWVIIAAAIFTVIAASYGLTVFSKLDSGGFTSPKFESYVASQEISNHFGNDQNLIVLFTSKNNLKVSDPAYEEAVDQTLLIARRFPGVTSITDYYATRAPQLVSNDGKSTYVVVDISGNMSQSQTTATNLRPKLTSSVLEVRTGGFLGINADFNAQIAKDLAKAETISFIALAVLLLIVFRSLVAAPLPLILGGFGVMGAFLAVRLLTNVMTISQYAINVIILLGLGLSIDYSLFMVNRFREELRHHESDEALLITMRTAGRTVFFSGLTVILSLSGLLIFPLSFLQSMGVGASSAVLVAMIGALTVLPALMAILGNKVNALSFGRVAADYNAIRDKKEVPKARRSIWYQVGRAAMWQPVLTIGVIVIPLVFVGQYFLQAQFSSADYRSLPPSAQSRQVAQVMANDFPGGNTNPIQVVIHTPASPTSPSVAPDLANYVKQLNNQPGVTAVSEQLSGDYVIANVTYNSGYDELLARDLVQVIRAQSHPSSWSVNVGGMTAELVDLLSSIDQHAVYAGLIVAASLFCLLLFMFRSIAVPLEALFVNILSLSATFGILVWMFQYGHLSKLLGFSSLGSIDSTQPVLIFGIAFGLSMDYSVFLFSRIKEQYDQSHDVYQSIAGGLDKTGTIITSAALLFIVVVAAFATSSISLIKQIGIGLGLAVFIDAFLVRMLLMPAIMRIVGHANWWGPKWMRRRTPVLPD